MLRERLRDVVERQAGAQRRVLLAGNAEVHVLVAAEARAHADGLGLVDDVRRPLVVEDVVRLLVHQHGLLHERASELGVHAEKQVFDEILFDKQVLVEQLAQVFLVDVAARAHQRELKKADHRRGHRELPRAFVFRIDHQALLAKMIEDRFRLRLRHAPDLRRLFQAERTDRQL